jgi:hypothetical protein
MENYQNTWAKIVARAWSDADFKKRLVNNTKEVCKEYGIELPKGIEYKVNDQTDRVIYLNLPKKPEGELSEEELQSIAGGQMVYDPNAPGGQQIFTGMCVWKNPPNQFK